jgi:uncharacterized protein YdcH (DUF465 family)
MSDTPHELNEEFPELRAKIHEMKVGNPHFRKLHDEYHDLNREIHRGETNIEPMDDLRIEKLRKQRLKLKDELYGMLRG